VGIQVEGGGGLKMCSEYHSFIPSSKAFRDNLYVLGRVAYVDYHL